MAPLKDANRFDIRFARAATLDVTLSDRDSDKVSWDGCVFHIFVSGHHTNQAASDGELVDHMDPPLSIGKHGWRWRTCWKNRYLYSGGGFPPISGSTQRYMDTMERKRFPDVWLEGWYEIA
ncbi:hypothetical protein NUW54_g13324 [Trametes sanguinea]|uniref:Uncharacterized protein n=1 Tax=Trametes sanguinea TaxID=158606 RepID=A0ACC1MN14_9APHY|nr:hypothetical protein NUW54_g13324 [Trametes sanguinea]